jgi:hypothetical protein
MDFAQLKKVIEQVEEVSKNIPKKVKVNELWLSSQIINGRITKSEYNSIAMGFTGIPVEIDNSIDNFEFIYE